ncbi:MAG: hypothetical protein AAF518_13635 [Spirochaetota bacterium]
MATGVGREDSTWIVWSSVFLVLSGVSIPVYFPFLKSRQQKEKKALWLSWERVAKFLGLRFYMPEQNTSFPSISGVFKNHSVSITSHTETRGASTKEVYYTKFHIPIANAEEFYFSLRDTDMSESEDSFFQNRICFLSNNHALEERFIIKTNQENHASFLLNDSKLARMYTELPLCMLEISGQSFTLTFPSQELTENRTKFILDFSVAFVQTLTGKTFLRVA